MVADLFHHGHVEFLEQARDLGGYLIVGLAGDEDAADGKRDPILKVEERAKVMAACRYVDEVIPNAPWRIDASWIAQHHIDIVVHGDDYDKKELDNYTGCRSKWEYSVLFPIRTESQRPKSYSAANRLIWDQRSFRVQLDLYGKKKEVQI